jgi:hypothetical protein
MALRQALSGGQRRSRFVQIHKTGKIARIGAFGEQAHQILGRGRT